MGRNSLVKKKKKREKKSKEMQYDMLRMMEAAQENQD